MVSARRRGLTFEEWWEEAVRPGRTPVMTNTPSPPPFAVRWPSDRNDRIEWLNATVGDPEARDVREREGAKEGWRRAYEQQVPSRAEEALAFVADSLGVLAEQVEAIGDAVVADEGGDIAELMAA